jgi:hypothetical protein
MPMETKMWSDEAGIAEAAKLLASNEVHIHPIPTIQSSNENCYCAGRGLPD